MTSTKEIIRRHMYRHRYVYLSLCGLAGGLLNGFLGAGGGIIFIFFLNFMLGVSDTEGQKDVFALSLGAVFFITLCSVFFYARTGALKLSDASDFILPAIAGGLIGAALFEKINIGLLRVVFSAVIIYSGISML